MKTKNWTRVATMMALAAGLAWPAAAQDDLEPRRPAKEPRPAPADPFGGPPQARKNPKGAPGDMIDRLRRELADLEAASSQRRSELMLKMAELEARAEAERRKAEAPESGVRERLNWPSMFQPQEPEWVIGIMIEEQGKKGDAAGIKVQSVPKGTPADKAGVKRGDVIVACNGIRLRDREALVHIIQAARDQVLTLTVRRETDRAGDGMGEVELKVRAEKRKPTKGEMGMGKRMGQFGNGQEWQPGMIGPANQKEVQELRKQVGEIKKTLEELNREFRKLKTPKTGN